MNGNIPSQFFVTHLGIIINGRASRHFLLPLEREAAGLHLRNLNQLPNGQ